MMAEATENDCADVDLTNEVRRKICYVRRHAMAMGGGAVKAVAQKPRIHGCVD